MTSDGIICFVDARHNVERSFFQKEKILHLIEGQFSKCDFVFLVKAKSDKTFIPNDCAVVFEDDFSDFSSFVKLMGIRSRSYKYVLLLENELFPDSIFIDKLKNLKRNNEILVPEMALVMLADQTILQSCQTPSKPQGDWTLELFLCAGFLSKILNEKNINIGPSVFDDLGESFFQFAVEQKFALNTCKNSCLYAQAHAYSWGRFLGVHKKSMSYYSTVQTPNDQKGMVAWDILKKVEVEEKSISLITSDELKRRMGFAANIDPRWLRISTPTSAPVESHKFVSFEVDYYRDLCRQLESCSYVLIVNHLRRGGTEKEAILHIREYTRLYPDKTICLVLTLPTPPDLDWQLPSSVKIIEYGKLVSPVLDEWAREYLLYRVLDQVGPEIIHLKYSQLGWIIFERYGKQLSLKSKLWISFYCVDYNVTGESTSFAFQHLFGVAPYLDSIFADNYHALKQITKMAEVKNSRKIFYPVECSNIKWVSKKQDRKFKILWCSRLSFQKNLDILFKVAGVFPDIEFHIYGEISEPGTKLNLAKKLNNIKVWGIFDGIEEIPLNEFEAFLYTSYWDGLPNILLEVGATGMPVISPDLGGISEILNAKNSFLYKNMTELIDILGNWKTHRKKAPTKGRELRSLIRTSHSWPQFTKTCKEIYGQ